jgi:hypothetical protein
MRRQRCAQCTASLVEGAYIEALASLLHPFIAPGVSIDEHDASKTARDYYSGEADGTRIEAIGTRLAQYGITAEQILAKAMQLCGPGISMFNRMEAHCETSLRMLRKENDHRPSIVQDPDQPNGVVTN